MADLVLVFVTACGVFSFKNGRGPACKRILFVRTVHDLLVGSVHRTCNDSIVAIMAT